MKTALGDARQHTVINTQLHSDHCGGNAALSAAYPGLEVLIPPGQAAAVKDWDTEALSYGPTGQICPPFQYTNTLSPGDSIALGDSEWLVLAAKGHDPHSIILFQQKHGVLISADALWANGFGVVFPELDGIDAFDEVGATLDLIESISPHYVIPGHGSVFTDLTGALQRARSRLAQFQESPQKHRRHAVKVLLKFKLLEWQQTDMPSLIDWFGHTPYFHTIAPLDGMGDSSEAGIRQYLQTLLKELEKACAVEICDSVIRNR
jgi:glyoxylase-like metal-dependent hydrolase (beta-lactamase superfamily II)